MTPTKAEPEGPVVGPAKEQTGMMDYEALARMPLESLLYYVLMGEGKKRSEVEGLRGDLSSA